MIREPVVAGQFYSSSPAILRKDVSGMVSRNTAQAEIVAVVSPHAGYVYSGPVAGQTLSLLRGKDRIILLGTNHTGLGDIFGVDFNESWRTPLGCVKIDRDLAESITKGCVHIKKDNASHEHEHSIEVQLPFLQTILNEFEIVPITISHADLSLFREAGIAIADAIKQSGLRDRVAIVASSDMTHYEPLDVAEKKDSLAIKCIIDLDEEALIRTVTKYNITMCGLAPVVVMMVAAKRLGASKASLVNYTTSAEMTGDNSSVVGYAGIALS